MGGDKTVERYVQLRETLNQKGTVIPLADYLDDDKLDDIISKRPGSDWYTSLYTYDKSAKELFDEKGSIAGYNGPASSNSLFFDFDCKEDPEKAKQDTIQLCGRLISKGVVAENVSIHFSGNKGFHLELLTDREFSPDDMKNICKGLTEGLNTFDSQIYNTTRIVRINNTRHQSTKLYKIEIEPAELKDLSIVDIKARAKKTVNLDREVVPVADASFVEDFKVVKPVVVDSFDGDSGSTDTIDFSKCPATMPRCLFAMSLGHMAPGSRSRLFFRLAAYYRGQGMDKEANFGALKGVARLNARIYPDADPIDKEEIWNQHIATTYGPNAKYSVGGYGTAEDNEFVEEYCESLNSDRKCVLHAKNTKTKTVMRVDEISSDFSRFAVNFDKNIVKTGIKFIDEHMKITVGTTTLLVGAPGSGKTTVCLNIMENANKNGLNTMFFSLDMHKTLIYLKLAQKLTDYSQDAILEIYKNQEFSKIDEIKDKIASTYDRTFFDFSGTLTLEQMVDKIQETERANGVKIKFVVVDYASRISGPHADTYANARHNALMSKTAADDTDTAFIILSQVSRATGDGSSPLRTKRAAKESGDWEESATNVITIWRPFMGMDGKTIDVKVKDDDGEDVEHQVDIKDNVIRLFMAKNRMGPELEQALSWNGARGIVRDVHPDKLEEYEDPNNPEGVAREKAVLRAKFAKN